ncbi:hypothetical protein LSUE1_G001295 [Lachnellula suecica]|uniref:Uncharacterized protein n=1 Tax=Lachnellula suecica TaxID=602035 RepID=A0A8T9CIM0_9HELO|nr:hypothetical protein LSUE1_G001295 [Lachnellula suecica]
MGIVKVSEDAAAEVFESCSKPISKNENAPRMPITIALSKLGLHASKPTPPERTTTTPKATDLSEMEDVSTEISIETSDVPLGDHGQNPNSHVDFQNPDNRMSQSSKPAWQHIQRLRVDIWSLRSRIHELRARLREKQTAKSAADDKLFQRIRLQELLELSQKPNNARDEYGPVEDDCNLLEDQLSAHEFRLARIEEDFYNRPTEDPVQYPEDSSNPAFHLRSTSSRGSEASLNDLENIDVHPKVSKFLSKLGDLDLLRERYGDFVDDKEALEEERDSRKRFQLPLDTEDQAWLDDSTKVEEELLEEIRIAETEVSILRKECLERGLVDEKDEPTNFESQEKATFKDEEDVSSLDQTSEYVKYPVLLPQPGMKPEEVDGYDLEPDEKSDNSTTRINKWLLQQLQSSPLDVWRLENIFEREGGKINDGWQHLVLSFWYKDGTITASRGIHLYSSSLTTHAAGPRSNQSELYHF